jgi:hypothetical protein
MPSNFLGGIFCVYSCILSSSCILMFMKKYFILLIATALFFACRKNDTVPTSETVDDTTTVTASIRGVVVNENDVPVMGATVTVGTNTATTNAYGIFEFRNKSISKNNTHVKVTKAGYFNGNRSMLATAGRTHQVRIKLQPKTTTGTVNAASGGVVTMASGSKVTFPANAIIDASGAAYTGTVNVAMAYINPTATDLASTLQGDLRGIATAGGERVLETYGMVGVELTTPAGQALKIANGKTAELSSPIPATLQAAAPTTIPLWHFDETKGRWVEEGSATKVGNNYVGSVTHFSFWNYDIGANGVTLCVTVVTPSNQPLNNVPVRIRRVNNPASFSYGYTDSLGNVCGAVFKNEPLTLDVLDRCGGVVYTQNIGPYSANASVTVTATIPPVNSITLTGNVTNCSNAAVTNGGVYIVTNNGHTYNAPVNASGAFSLTIPITCGGMLNYTVLPFDNAVLQQGAPIGGSSINGIINLGTLQACGTTSVEFINTLIGGVPYVWTSPTDTIGTMTIIFPIPNRIVLTANNSAQKSFLMSSYFNSTLGVKEFYSCNISVNTSANTIMNISQIITPNPQITYTSIGPRLVGYIEGNFNIDCMFQPGNVTRNVQCNFKVRNQ